MRKWKHRRAEWLAHSHTPGVWQRWNLNPGQSEYRARVLQPSMYLSPSGGTNKGCAFWCTLRILTVLLLKHHTEHLLTHLVYLGISVVCTHLVQHLHSLPVRRGDRKGKRAEGECKKQEHFHCQLFCGHWARLLEAQAQARISQQ